MAFSGFLDTCVLVPSALRDLLLELAERETFRPLWSDAVFDELRRTITTLQQGRGVSIEDTQGYVDRLLSVMNQAFPDARVEHWGDIIGSVSAIPDPDDRHVVAAAVLGRADVIVTFNLRDFPAKDIPGDIFSEHPDDFLLNLFGLYPDEVQDALEAIAARSGRKGPIRSVDTLLERLEKENVGAFVATVLERNAVARR